MSNVPSGLRPSEIQHVEFTRAHREHIVPQGVTMDDLMDPEYWCHVAKVLKPGDLIDVRNADFSIDTTLRVVATDPYETWAQVVERGKRLPSQPVLAGKGAADASGLTIQHDSVKGWRVLRGREELASKLESEEAAVAKRNEIAAEQNVRRSA